ncbi:hypothetical protein EQM14_12000 [Caproiciproducens sp. NJN-50]|uniref:hypothetical protein n=1 Tax=Acutalibacteraceae TaxID=3082771 RepID=UPI000FFE00BB|nr:MULTISPECIES: hypothetical protein [Acutalibacteraceae]QAT50425.1 hypothetical protein EQM14_12000 [Caproiciproducens sp. NJN-50]
MDSAINEKIRSAQQGIARLHKIDAVLQDLQNQQSQLNRKAAGLKVVLEKENCDVDKMENKSIASVFYSLFGKLEERVEKEQAEAFAAKLKYDQAIRDLDNIQDQISKLSAERLNYVNCQRDFDALYADKKERIVKESGASAQKILELSNQINSERINLKEIEEAASAGKEALASLDRIQNSLGHAEGWGTWDLLGGGLISDLAKHSHIDDAKEETENAQRLLRQFHAELADVRIRSDIHIETGGFAKFADFFFDGLIADWFMQSKIDQSQESVSHVQSQVRDAVQRLESMRSQANSNIGKIEAEMESLIITAR